MSGETLGEAKVVRDMHERKSEMAKHADAFIALPGELLADLSTPPPSLSISHTHTHIDTMTLMQTQTRINWLIVVS